LIYDALRVEYEAGNVDPNCLGIARYVTCIDSFNNCVNSETQYGTCEHICKLWEERCDSYAKSLPEVVRIINA